MPPAVEAWSLNHWTAKEFPLNSTLGGHTQGVTCTGIQGKAATPKDPGPDLPAGLGGSPGEAGVAVAHCGDKDTSGRSPREYSST